MKNKNAQNYGTKEASLEMDRFISDKMLSFLKLSCY